MKNLLAFILVIATFNSYASAGAINKAENNEKRLNCYTSSVLKIWDGYNQDKMTSQQVLYNLAASGAISYDYDLESIISVNTIKSPSELLGLKSEKAQIQAWQADKFYLSIEGAGLAALFLNKKINQGVYAEIKKIPGCEGIFK
jgi:hypothetical protein